MFKVLAVGDVHFPWASQKTLSRIYSDVSFHKPDVIVQMGDLYDFFSASRFARSHSLLTPTAELTKAHEMAQIFWEKLQKAAKSCQKTAKCIQIKGNHDDRPYKRLLEKSPELEPFFDIDRYFKFKGVETIYDSREELLIDNVLYTHGHYSKLGDHMKYYLRSVVRAHDHTGGVVTMNLNDKTVFELDVGYVADKNSTPLKYSPTKTVRWTKGYGFIDQFGPRFIPLPE